ncbi:MAG: DbpA RNA binding domain-containing protein, partial [Planctomycetota bacterium]|nr:DbpA RNA binding domain-containing protein [Planctomycetota bacterium]
VFEIAAAAVKLAHESTVSEGEDSEIPAGPAGQPPAFGKGGFDRGPDRGQRGGERGNDRGERPKRGPQGPTTRLYIGAGRLAGIRPGDLVGAITNEANMESRDLGAIEIADRFSLIEVPDAAAEQIIAALRATTIRGKRVSVRRDREGH